MSCEGCSAPERGLYIAGCRACTLRHIACGPEFHASMRRGKLTPEYRALLVPLGGVAVHAEVREAAKAVFMGATPA